MSNDVINISNRLVIKDGAVAGGLDNTLKSCKGFDTIIRLGFSGKTISNDQYNFGNIKDHITTSSRTMDDGRTMVFHLLDLPEEHYRAYYERTANGDFWMSFHDRPDLVCGDNESRRLFYETTELYVKAVNAVAEHCKKKLYHDYHLLSAAHVTRQLGYNHENLVLVQHIPMVSADTFGRLDRDTQDFIGKILKHDIFAYSGISMQTGNDVAKFEDFNEISSPINLRPYETKRVTNKAGESTIIGVFPATGDTVENQKTLRRMLENGAANRFLYLATDGRIVDGKKPEGMKLISGADRIDPSKAIHKRIQALDILFRQKALDPRVISYIQAAAQSREVIPGYQEEIGLYAREYTGIRRNFNFNAFTPTNSLGEFAPLDQGIIFVIYHNSDMGLFVSDIDGMHLGPKEMTDVSNPDNPAVCVLTKTIGAASEFRHCAIITDPSPEGIAQGILEADRMPLEKRVEQHQERQRIMAENNNQRWIGSIAAMASNGYQPTYN